MKTGNLDYDRVALELWLDLLDREGAAELMIELQDLYEYGTGQGFSPKLLAAFSITERGAFGDHLLQLLKVNCNAELLQLLAAWKRFKLLLRDLPSDLEATGASFGFASSSQLGWFWSSGNVHSSWAPAGPAASLSPAVRRRCSEESLPFLPAAAEQSTGTAEQTAPVPAPRRSHNNCDLFLVLPCARMSNQLYFSACRR